LHIYKKKHCVPGAAASEKQARAPVVQWLECLILTWETLDRILPSPFLF
jgi:hypothetical protein